MYICEIPVWRTSDVTIVISLLSILSAQPPSGVPVRHKSVLFSSQCIQIGFFFFFKETRDVAITKLLFLGTIQRFTIAALQRKRQKLCSQLVPHRKPDWIFMLQYAIAQFYLTMLKVGNAAEQCEENRWIVTKGKWTPLHVGCTGRGRGMSECVDGHERLRGWEREMFGAALQKRGWHKPRVIYQNFFLLLPPFLLCCPDNVNGRRWKLLFSFFQIAGYKCRISLWKVPYEPSWDPFEDN